MKGFGLLTVFAATLVSTALAASPPGHAGKSPNKPPGKQPGKPPGKPTDKPNFVFIIVDDQDAVQNSFSTMHRTQKLLVEQGTSLTRFYASVSSCCPSRASFLRAQEAHNTNVTSVRLPYGGWSVFNEFGYNGHWLPSFMQNAGYGTYYVGKLMNGQDVNNYKTLPAQGFTESEFLLDPFTYDYWNATFSYNNAKTNKYINQYSTDVVADKGLRMLDSATKDDKPFFVAIAPIGPHFHVNSSLNANPRLFDVPIPAPRHEGMFADYTLNHDSPAFNPEQPSGVSWVRQLTRLNQTQVDYIENWYRKRLEALQAVDEMVERIVKKLEESGKLDNTYIIYTSDNGYECNAGHRRQPGKTTPYEPDILVPLAIRGPEVPKGFTDTKSIHSLADLGATIMHLAGAKADYEIDASIMPITPSLQRQMAGGSKGKRSPVKTHHLVEYWGEGSDVEGIYAYNKTFGNATYRSVRVTEDKYDLAYAVWCTGEHEFFDMKNDPAQMKNLYEQPQLTKVKPGEYKRLMSRLDGLLLVLKTCKGDVCRYPWAEMFPDGKVDGLKKAMQPKYDKYFDGLPKVEFSKCTPGYLRNFERPFWESKLAYSKK
ncbi:hypothetical protein OIO90_001972 [Microbotryomycetes sp. JL221]|nr:hypothetical protein OIO90_001972 [Microbotryomycetes sp. JL221]